MPKSKVLILIIGSNHKQTGGQPGYQRASSILPQLSDTAGNRLLEGRKRILRWIKRGGVSRHGLPIADLPGNRFLVDGPDLNGSSDDGRYLPAAARFQGRLFARLEPDAAKLLTETQHHLLILTGLYGLVTPTELIQDHQVHIDDHRNLHAFWTDNDLLTDVLLDYIRQNKITQVLDLTAQNSYRFLIAWERVRAEPTKVWHCFGTQSVGDELLLPLGHLARELLVKSRDGMVPRFQANVLLETPFEQVYFSPWPRPADDAPRELGRQRAQVNDADELGRMRRCFIRMMDEISPLALKESDDGVIERIKQLAAAQKIPSDIAEQMKYITTTRNHMEYGRQHLVTARVLENVRTEYPLIKKWAKRKNINLSDECLEI